MLTSAASALVCADPRAESAIPVVIELSVRALKVLATATASRSASAIPPSAGNAALANCCVPVARFTTAAYPCPRTHCVCAATRAAAGVRPPIAPIATTPRSHRGTPLVTMLLMVGCPPRQRLSRRHDGSTVVRHSSGGALVQLDVAARQRAFSMVHIATAEHVETDEVPAVARLAGVTRFGGEVEGAVGRSLILELGFPGAGPDAAIGVRVFSVVSDGRLVKRETAERARRGVGCAVEAMLHPLDMALIGARVQAECGEVAATLELAAARDPAVAFVLHREERLLRGSRTRLLFACDEQRGGQQAGDQLQDDCCAHAICLLAVQRESRPRAFDESSRAEETRVSTL